MPSEEVILFYQVKCHLRVKVNTVILLPGCWQMPGILQNIKESCGGEPRDSCRAV